ncbi:MAG: hypothetical protein N4A57_02705 [Anaeromicrobium sp.]|jgi:hypothetical protein|nr:hypothetical protein [Anaeromicrobium sp.]MCT4593171.1 hypothetical protein [Anaeromicrobium sp.]
MEQLEPKFLKEGYGYYTDDGLQIRNDAPQWAKEEYGEFMKQLNINEISE